MRLTFNYELEDGTTGTVTTRAADVSHVERKTGDLLTRGVGYHHCTMLVHRVLTREAKRNGTKGVKPFEQWLEDELVDVEPVGATEPQVDAIPFEDSDSPSP